MLSRGRKTVSAPQILEPRQEAEQPVALMDETVEEGNARMAACTAAVASAAAAEGLPTAEAEMAGAALQLYTLQSLRIVRERSEKGARRSCCVVSDLPCNFRREGGQSLVIGGSSLVILEGKGV